MNADSYWQETRKPVSALLFLAPLIAVYEAGIVFVNAACSTVEMRNMAEVIVRSLAGLAGVVKLLSLLGIHRTVAWLVLSGLVVILVLIIWQFKSRKPWRVRPVCLAGMLGESLLYGAALLAVLVLFRKLSPSFMSNPADEAGLSFGSRLALSLGAGIFEEFLFRLVGVGLIFLFLNRSLEIPRHGAFAIAAIVTALAFAGFHLLGPFGAEFNPWSFGFRTFAGVYFACLLALRGFGITAGAHAAYDIILVLAGSATT